jgi:hypothetical protein
MSRTTFCGQLGRRDLADTRGQYGGHFVPKPDCRPDRHTKIRSRIRFIP